MSMLYFFFFKQKTAYEMRISDWSSDVCSSDLRRAWQLCAIGRARCNDRNCRIRGGAGVLTALPVEAALPDLIAALDAAPNAVLIAPPGAGKTTAVAPAMLGRPWRDGKIIRSEEHTSELQSLMRISYAVFCLK